MTLSTAQTASLTNLRKAWKSIERAKAKMLRANGMGWEEQDKAIRSVERAERKLLNAQIDARMKHGSEIGQKLNALAAS